MRSKSGEGALASRSLTVFAKQPLTPTLSPQERGEGEETPMPLQNRVTPSGEIIATPHRGLFVGNRGIIHDPATKTLLQQALVGAGLAHLRA